jgi:hypothetical protein
MTVKIGSSSIEKVLPYITCACGEALGFPDAD